MIIAIDGPSGSGKSSVSRTVASRLGVGYLDTGAMYRALTWWCLDQGIDLDDRDAVTDAAGDYPLAIGTDPEDPVVQVGDTDVTRAIRTPEVTAAVTKVATNTDVRPILQQAQRDLMAAIAEDTGGCVAEGRDITTVVAPDAHVRILLTASEEARNCTVMPRPRPWRPPGTRSSSAMPPTPRSRSSQPPPTASSPWTPQTSISRAASTPSSLW